MVRKVYENKNYIFNSGLLPAQDLINAVKSGDIQKVSRLMPYDSIDETDENYYTAYHWTAVLGRTDIAELLLKNGAEYDALVTDIPYRRIDDDYIIWSGKPIGAQSAAVLAEENGWGDEIIKFYINQGKAKNNRDLDLNLRAGVMCINEKVVYLALEEGADPDFSINMGGDRILALAVELYLENKGTDQESEAKAVIDNLLDYGASIPNALKFSNNKTVNEELKSMM